MAALNVKIHIANLGLLKTFQVLSTDRVEAVIQSVQEKVAGTEAKPNENYGLFYNDPEDGKKSHWLMNSKTIGFYDIENGTTLFYKDKNRYLKVKMLDETIKTVLVDDSKSVGHALDLICEKIGINTLNADEYALFIEEEKEIELPDVPVTHRKASLYMMDLIMDKVDQLQEKKVQTLKKKAHTDDDTNWLRNNKTLREAGVHDDSIVVIRRRYMYEQSVNITNPVEINLLYVQSRDAILDGSHPCQLDEAARFAAYQIQVQHGDFDELRYKSGHIDLKEFVPKEYLKNKETLKKVKEEHSKLVGINELDCKYKYIQLCQNLATYGVTFFVVKEKVTGKNKLIPRLFGVSKESCFRLDEKTKQVLKVWPLTTVRRWAASPTSFTLDFGDYKEGMYTVVTNEGKQICQLIGGYIDIILKRRKRIKMLTGDGDDNGVISEGTNLPCRRIDISRNNFSNVKESIPQYPKKTSIQGHISSGQQALITNLDNNSKTILMLVDELNEESINETTDEPVYAELEIRKDDGDNQIEKLLSNIATGVVSVVNKTSANPSEDDLLAVGNSVTTLTSNLTDLTRKLKMHAKSSDNQHDHDHRLLDAAKDLASAFKELLTSLNPKENNRSGVIISVNNISRAFIKINGEAPKNQAFNQVVLEKVNGIVGANDSLLTVTKEVSQALDKESYQKINTMAVHSKEKMTQFTSSINLLLPYINSSNTHTEVSELIKQLQTDANTLGGLCLVASNTDDLKYKIQSALVNIIDSSDALLKHVEKGSEKFIEQNMFDILLDANDLFFKSNGDSDEMIKQSIIIGQVCAQLAKSMELSADDNPNEKEKKVEAVAQLSRATADLLKSAKLLRADPDDEGKQAALKSMVIKAQSVANMVTGDGVKTASIVKLRDSAVAVLKSTTQMLTAAKNVAMQNTDLSEDYKKISTAFISMNAKGLSDAVKESEANPRNEIATRKLVSSSKYFIPAASRVIFALKDLITPDSKSSGALQLSQTILDAEKSVKEFSEAANKACQNKLACDQALYLLKKCVHDLDKASLSATGSPLKIKRKDSLKTIESSIVALCENADSLVPVLIQNVENNCESIGTSVSNIGSILSNLSEDAASFAVSSQMSLMPSKQAEMLAITKTVFESAILMLNALKESIDDSESTSDLQTAVIETGDNFKTALKEIQEFLKGVFVDDGWDCATKSVEMNKQNLATPIEDGSESAQPYLTHQENIFRALKMIDKDAHSLAERSCTSPHDLEEIFQHVSLNYEKLCEDLKFAAKLVNPELGQEFIATTQELGDACIKIMRSAKKIQLDFTEVNKKAIAEDIKDVSSKVASIVSNIEKGSVGIQECVKAISTLDGLISDIDTTRIVAESHTLTKNDDSAFNQHKEDVLVSIQNVGKGVKALTNLSSVSQENLATLVKDAVVSTNKLGAAIKKAATALGAEDADGQTLLLNAVKDVMTALRDLINETKKTSGNPDNNSAEVSTKATAKHMVGNLASLLKTVRSVEDESSRGARAVESTVEAIRQAVIQTTPSANNKKTASPDDLIQATKGITLAIAKVVAAGDSLKQADIIDAANFGRMKCLELFEVAQGVIQSTDDDIVREAVICCVTETNQLYCNALNHLVQIQAQPDLKAELPTMINKVTQSIGELVDTAEELREISIYQSKPEYPTLKFVLKLSETGNDLILCKDPNKVAEVDLLEAVSSVEASAKKLTELNPNTFSKSGYEPNFEDRILEAAKVVISASASLLKAACLLQKELVETGKIGSSRRNSYVDSHQWSDGLISAARLVVSTTDSLCDSANDVVLGNASQEKLIAAAQSVSASTAHLLLASRVRANPFSKAQKGLQIAGTAVKYAAEKLVKTTKEAALNEVEDIGFHKRVRRGTKTSEIIEQIEAQETILKKERELNMARRRLELLREAQYAKEKAEEDSYSKDESATRF